MWPTILPTHLTHLPHPTRFLGSVLIFQYQRTVLHNAAFGGQLSCVTLLLEHGANLEATGNPVRGGGCEVVVRSWWWRERGEEVTVTRVPLIRDPLGRSIRLPRVPSVVPRGVGWRRGAGRA